MYEFMKGAVVAAAALVGTDVAAAPIYASSVQAMSGDGSITSCSVAAKTTDRADLCNSLGAPDVDGAYQDGGFTSTGNYSELTYTFGGLFNVETVSIWEVTGSRSMTYIETLDFTLRNSVTGAETTGSVTNINGTPAGPDRWLLVANTPGMFDQFIVSDNSVTYDGFDIDAVSIAAVPLPATALLMIAGLGAFGAVRRKS